MADTQGEKATAVCVECKGSGMVQIGPGIRGVKACPSCHPKGFRCEIVDAPVYDR